MADEEIGGTGEIAWVQVALAQGSIEAGMIVEYLRAEGIQAVAWQEGVGNAMGLYTGGMGTAKVMVPEASVDEALALLEVDEGYDPSITEEDEPTSGLTKAVLGATAVVMNPIGAGIAVGLSYFMGSDPQDEENLVTCRECETPLTLSREEEQQGWYVCPECNNRITLVVLSRCPNCQTELELNDTEVLQRWYRCSECDELVQLK